MGYCKAGIVCDIAPFDYANDKENQIGLKNKLFTDFLLNLNLNQDNNQIRNEILKNVKSPIFVDHLMDCIRTLPDGNKEWKHNLKVLSENFLTHIAPTFPTNNITQKYLGPVKVIATNSTYVRPEGIANYYKIFERFDEKKNFVRVNSRHFINFDDPELLTDEIASFLNEIL